MERNGQRISIAAHVTGYINKIYYIQSLTHELKFGSLQVTQALGPVALKMTSAFLKKRSAG